MTTNARVLVAALVLSTAVSAAPLGAQARRAEAFFDYDFRRQPISAEAVAQLTGWELAKLRAVILGRHGRTFREASLQDYLASQSWYRRNPAFSNALLNDLERQTLDVIREAEAAKHDSLQLGDMRFYRTRKLNRETLGAHTPTEWRILEAEVEAEHGKRFDDEPWLQAYFEERYWYRPNPAYSEALLSPIERENLATLRAARLAQRGLALKPGEIRFHRDRLLGESALHGLTLRELRLLRNEVYAVHGRPFKTEWLAEHFYGGALPFVVNPNFRESDLSEVERENVRTIARFETRLHESLSTMPLDTELLADLDLAELRILRNEIYARRGRVFRDKKLQTYFASLPWYKADPNFREELLSPIERQNALAILAYEKARLEEMTQVEG